MARSRWFRRIWSSVPALMLALLAVMPFAPQRAAADEPLVLQMSDDISGAHPLNVTWQAFADQVGKDTNGAVVIKFFPSGQLYNGPRAMQALATGALAFAAVSTPNMVGLVPPFEVFQLPYFAPGSADITKVSAPELPLFQYLSAQSAQKNVVLLPCPWWGSGAFGIIIRSKDIKAFADLKGMKIRSIGGGMYAEIVRELGASPIELAPPEVASSLQTGAIDGAMGTFEFLNTALSDVAKGIIDTGGFTLGGYVVVASKPVWDKIPARYQQIITRDLQNANRTYAGNLVKTNGETIAKLKASGHFVYEMTPAETSGVVALTRPLWQQFQARQPAVFDALTASRKRAGIDK